MPWIVICIPFSFFSPLYKNNSNVMVWKDYMVQKKVEKGRSACLFPPPRVQWIDTRAVWRSHCRAGSREHPSVRRESPAWKEEHSGKVHLRQSASQIWRAFLERLHKCLQINTWMERPQKEFKDMNLRFQLNSTSLCREYLFFLISYNSHTFEQLNNYLA